MVSVMAHGGRLIGRTRELASLHSASAAAREGVPAVVVLAGDAGVGKSRLVTELTAKLASEGFTCLAGRCVNLPDGGAPYLPLIDALRSVTAESWQRLAPHLRGVSAPSLSQLQIYDAVAELVCELAADAPLCLILEDIHWSDRSTRDLLRYLLGRLESERVMILLTYRSDDVDRRHPLRPFLAEIARLPQVTRVTIDPLPPEGIAELVLAEGDVSDSQVADIVARADGNAFFAEELRDAALANAQGRSPAVGAPRSADALPGVLRDVLTARLERLGPGAATVVGVAAVAGRRVAHEALASVTGLGETELDESLREAIAHHVLVPDPEVPAYEFRHALMQEAAYADLLPGERVRLHRAYADVLAAELDSDPAAAAELAYHAELSLNMPRALAASMSAGEHARAVHAPGEAQRHFERVLRWWSAVDEAEELAGCDEIGMYLLAAQAAGAAGDSGRATVLLETADRQAELGSDRAVKATVRATLAQARYHAGDPRAVETSAEALELAEPLGPCEARALARSIRAVTLFYGNDSGTAEMARLALADAEATGAIGLQADALITLARFALGDGDPARSEHYFTRALDLVQQSGDVATELRALFNLAVSHADRGDLAQAAHWTRRSIERAAATGMRDSEYAKITRGIDYSVRYMLGDWDSILAELPEKTPAAVRVSRAIAVACIRCARGKGPGEPLSDHRDSLGQLSGRALTQIDALAAIVNTERALWRGDAQAARAHVHSLERQPVEQWCGETLERLWLAAVGIAGLADVATLARMRGDLDAALAAVVEGDDAVADVLEVIDLAASKDARLDADMAAWCARAQAEHSRLRANDDPAPWRKALAAFDFGYRYEVARCQWRLAAVLIDRAQRAKVAGASPADDAGGADDASGRLEAADLLQAAHATASELRAEPLVAAVEATAQRARIPGFTAATAGSLLTSREAQVLDLLTQGRTNKQIGLALFISTKTASVHVSNLLAKLGAATRGEAVSLARGRGLI